MLCKEDVRLDKIAEENGIEPKSMLLLVVLLTVCCILEVLFVKQVRKVPKLMFSYYGQVLTFVNFQVKVLNSLATYPFIFNHGNI